MPNQLEFDNVSFGRGLEIRITKVPDPPTIGVATKDNRKATIAFTAPASDGGEVITSYTAVSTPGSITSTITQSGSGSITLVGLTNGTEYTFQVYATNINGNSELSDASNAVTPSTVPNPPIIGSVTKISSTSAVVAFTAPADNGGNTIVSYSAFSAPPSTVTTVSQSGSGTITVTGLTGGLRQYQVYATNSNGNSGPSDLSQAIVPGDAPGAPTIGAATATSGTTATVAFTAPASSGGQPITSYTATSSPEGKTGTLSQAGSGTITVTGLTPGSAYTFTVSATSLAGTGTSSSASNSVTMPVGPGAPTIGTATFVVGSRATVSYTAPASDGGSAITSYTAVSTPGNITGTVSQIGSGTITVNGLVPGTTYTFVVYATSIAGNGAVSESSNSIFILGPPSQQDFLTSGTYTWVCPAGVDTISVVAIGGGQTGEGGSSNGAFGGAGGALAYRNNYGVTSGYSYTVIVGAGGIGSATLARQSGSNTSISLSGTTICLASGGGQTSPAIAEQVFYAGGVTGTKGSGVTTNNPGGGGAGGYAGAGGNGGYLGSAAQNGTGGSGAGGPIGTNFGGAGGGGVGVLGQGSNGVAPSGGGSGGTSGTNSSVNSYTGGSGGNYGAGGGGGGYNQSTSTPGNSGSGGNGALRIIWPGSTRTFPSTGTTTFTVPGAPTIGSATSTGTTTATVAFTQPASNGGSTIVSYTAVSTPGSITSTLSQAGSGTITVTGLSPGTSYTFVVYASSAVGDGSNSAASNSITTTALIPNAPTIGSAVATGATTAYVTYTAPTYNGGATITSYTAVSTPGSITGTLSQAGSGSINITGLSNNTSYTFVVYATNSAGNSSNSSASNSITTNLPNPPTIGLATQTGATTATVTFTAPILNGGSTIISYTAVSTPGNITATLVQAGSGTISVTGLTSATAYTFVVYATNANGNSVNSSASNSVTPTTTLGQLIASGEWNTYVIDYLGVIYGWGLNNQGAGDQWGAVGDGTTITRSTPTLVGGSFTTMSGGNQFAHAIKTDGTLWGWGQNNSGQLGDGTTSRRSSPVQIGANSNWVRLANSAIYIATMGGAINNLSQLFVWGYTDYGTFGNNVNVQARSSPVQVPGSWTQAILGYDIAIGLKTDGTVWTWGAGGAGQLGDNTTINRSSPVQIMSGSSFTAVAARGAGYGAMAIRTDGTLWSWGSGTGGSVGDGTTISRSQPVQVAGSWTTIAAGQGLSFGIKTDGTLWGWGFNSGYGMLGDGTTINRSAPVQIGSNTNWQYVSVANSNGAAARTSTGLLYVWGRSDAGTYNSYRIGDGAGVARSSPVQIGSSWNSPVVSVWSADFTSLTGSISVGSNAALALTSTSTIEFWIRIVPGAHANIYSVLSAGNAFNPFQFISILTNNAIGVGPGFTPVGSGLTCQTTSTLVADTWYHVACVINGGTLSIYRNGVAQGLSGTTTGWQASPVTTSMSIGNYVGGGSFRVNGYISNLRILSGTALYTGTFTPSTTTLTISTPGSTGAGVTGTVSSSTVKLLAFTTNTVTTDGSTNSLTLTTAGTVTATSSVVPF